MINSLIKFQNILKHFLFLIFIFHFIGIKSQGRTIEDLETALTLKLCEYVTWSTDTNRVFTIGLLSKKEKLIAAFQKLTPLYSIHKKKIDLVLLNNINNLNNIDIIFVDENQLNYMQKLNEIIAGKGILLFSENHKVAKEIMFNLLTNPVKGMVSFEFNRTNLIFEGFDIHPQIIELRGSEIDVRELYKQTKLRLEREEYMVQEMQKKLNNQTKNIGNQERIISSLNENIESKNDIINTQSENIKQKEAKLEELNKRLKLQEDEIEDKKEMLNSLAKDLKTINMSLEVHKEDVKNQLNLLDSLNNSISEKQKVIDEKEMVLTEKEGKITLRNRMILLLIFMSIIAFILLFMVFNANKQNAKAKMVLANQKEELEIALNKLKQAQNQLIQAEKMVSLGVLVAGIAHEINNPINFISSGVQGFERLFSEVVSVLNKYREKYGNLKENEEIIKLENELELSSAIDSVEKIITNMKTGIDRTVNIIKSLKVFSHSNEENMVKTNIHENIEMALTILKNQYKYNIEINKIYGKLPIISCYPGKLNQVFMNILSNAIHSIKDTGEIRILTELNDNNVVISIKDNGCGIPEEIQNKIFDPFFTTKEIGKGTGLGLSIAYSIIQEHHGEIICKSKVDEGTEFIIKLPAFTAEI